MLGLKWDHYNDSLAVSRVTNGWHDNISKDTVDGLFAWYVELPELVKINKSRSYFAGPLQNLNLHMSVDSSQDVFSAVGYCSGSSNLLFLAG